MFVQKPLTCVEICAGAGGQALGLAMAGFVHVALVEYEADYCNTLNQNRSEWNVICTDVREFDGKPYKEIVEIAKEYINKLGGFEKFAEWGLF